MVLISDLHDHRFGSNNEDLVDKIREQSPDLIIVDGDMINGDSENDETAVELVRSLTDIAPVYYSLGNHEYYYMEAGHDELQADLEEAGAVVLNYQNVDIEVNGNPIRLGGGFMSMDLRRVCSLRKRMSRRKRIWRNMLMQTDIL